MDADLAERLDRMERMQRSTFDLLTQVQKDQDTLVAALAEDEEPDQPARSLDGTLLPGERDPLSPL